MSTYPQVGIIPTFNIHDRLRKAREVAGFEQAELADRIGISRTSVSNYEAGRITKPRKIVLNAWAMATGVPVAWLETGVAPAPEDDGTPARVVGGGSAFVLDEDGSCDWIRTSNRPIDR